MIVGSGTTDVGGFVGNNLGGTTIASGYFDTDTSGQASAVGTDANGQAANVTAYTTAALQGVCLPVSAARPGAPTQAFIPICCGRARRR